VNITADIVYSIQEIANLAVSDHEFKKLDKDQLVQLFSNKVLIEQFRDKKISVYSYNKEIYRNTPLIKNIFDFDENNDSSFRHLFDNVLSLPFIYNHSTTEQVITSNMPIFTTHPIYTYISVGKTSIFLIKYKI